MLYPKSQTIKILMSDSTLSQTDSLGSAVQKILNARPVLGKLTKYDHLYQYLAPAVSWNPPADTFPYRLLLKKIITEEAKRLYGQETGVKLNIELDASWAVETGAHAHLPKRYDRPSKRQGAQINPLVFQGQMAWAAVNHNQRKNNFNLSLSSSRVPINNANSGCYFDYSFSAEPLRLVSNRYKETPQTFIPTLSVAQLQTKREQVVTLKNSKKINSQELELAQKILDVMAQHSAGTGLPDQIVTAHAAMISQALPPGLTQITLDSEEIGRQFLIELLGKPQSITYQIFKNQELYDTLHETLQNIATGWEKEESMFYQIDRSHSEPRFKEYTGALDSVVLQTELKQGTILPKGLLKFFVFMIEGGLCPIGGMNQSMYCTQLRDQSIDFLEQKSSDKVRTELLRHMPTDIATITPCWGTAQHEEGTGLINALDCIYQPLTNNELDSIAKLSGLDSLWLAAPSLCKLLLNKASSISYPDLKDMLQTKIINR